MIFYNSIPKSFETIDISTISHKFFLNDHLTPAVFIPPTGRTLMVMNELGLSYKDKTLMTGNKNYKLLEWDSYFEWRLQLTVLDSGKVRNIYKMFKKYILPLEINSDYKNKIAAWITERANFIGAFNDHNTEKFEKLIIQWDEDKRDDTLNAFKKMCDKIGQLEKEDFEYDSHSKNILIITSMAGGGHLATAQALLEYLNETQYTPHLVITDDLSNGDPYHIISGKSIESIYTDIEQSQGDIERAYAYYDFVDYFLPCFIKNEKNYDLRNRIKKIKPFLILNTLSRRVEFVSNSFSYKIPQLVLSTDYDVLEPADPILNYGSNDLLRLALPNVYTSVTSDARKRWSSSLVKNLESLRVSYEHSSFYELGYPVRKDINRFSTEEIKKIKTEFGVKEDERVVLIMMGAGGKQSIYSIVKKISELSHSNIRTFVFAARNKKLKTDLERAIGKLRTPISKKITVLSFIEATDLSKYYNIADVLISKPGGSATAEVLEIELPIIMHDLNNGEKLNKVYLQNSNLGKFAKVEEDIPKLLHDMLNEKPKMKASYKPLDWRSNLDKYIEHIIQKKEHLGVSL